MPDFALRPVDADRLAAYLATFAEPSDVQSAAAENRPASVSAEGGAGSVSAEPDTELVARGKQLVEKRGCVACHENPGVELPADFAPVLGSASPPASGCLRTDRAAGAAPYFTLGLADRVKLETFLARRPEKPSTVAPQEIAERTIRHTLQCFRCHTRDGTGGDALSRAILRYSGQGGTSDHVALNPPEISGAGARLHREWLLKMLAGNVPSGRPWLKVRMPGFALTEPQRDRIADRLQSADAIPDLKAPRPHVLPARRLGRAA